MLYLFKFGLAASLLGLTIAGRDLQEDVVDSALMQQKADLLSSTLHRAVGTGLEQLESLYARVGDFKSLFRGQPSDSNIVKSLVAASGAAIHQIGQKALYDLALQGVGELKSSSSFLRAGQSLAEMSLQAARKRAVLVAWKYSKGQGELLGTINDIKLVYRMLLERNFRESDITVLTDFEGQEAFFRGSNFTFANTDALKNKFTLMKKLKNAQMDLGPGDALVFHYSGHGSQVPDKDGDELDEKDEVLNMPCNLPIYCDYTDDEFYEGFLLNVPLGVQVTVVIDACHSEGFSDLPFNYMPGQAFWDFDSQSASFKEDRSYCTDWVEAKDLPNAVIRFFSASQNAQTSADMAMVVTDFRAGGAFTEHLISSWSKQMEAHKSGDMSTLFNRMKEVLVVFKVGLQLRRTGNLKRTKLKQEPNFFGWPMVRDIEPLNMWSNVHHDKAIGGPNPSSSTLMRAPPRCSHGGRNVELVKMLEDERPDFAASQKGSHILVDPTLRSAFAATRDDRMQGWQVNDRTNILFDPNNIVGVWNERSKQGAEYHHVPKGTVAIVAAAGALDIPDEYMHEFENLKERFVGATDEKVLQAIRRAGGNIRLAVRILRCQKFIDIKNNGAKEDCTFSQAF